MTLSQEQINKFLKVLLNLKLENAQRIRGIPGTDLKLRFNATDSSEGWSMEDYVNTMRALTQFFEQLRVALRNKAIDQEQLEKLKTVLQNINLSGLANGTKVPQKKLTAVLMGLDGDLKVYTAPKKHPYSDAELWCVESEVKLAAVEAKVEKIEADIKRKQAEISVSAERRYKGYFSIVHGVTHRTHSTDEAGQFVIEILEKKLAHEMERLFKSFVAAIDTQDIQVVIRLINRDRYGLKPLFYAVKNAHEAAVTFLLEKIALLDKDTKKPYSLEILSEVDQAGDTLLMHAVRSRNIEIVSRLMRSLTKLDLDAVCLMQNTQGENILSMAIFSKNLKLLSLIKTVVSSDVLATLLLQKNKNGDNLFMALAKQEKFHSSLEGLLTAKPAILQEAFAARNDHGEGLRDIILASYNSKLHKMLDAPPIREILNASSSLKPR